MKAKISNFNQARQVLALGIEIFFVDERVWMEVKEGQLNASCPDFITKESGSLKKHVYHEKIGDRCFIMINGTKKVNDVLIGDPSWQLINGDDSKAVDVEIVHAYASYYSYDALLFNEELQEIKKEVEVL